MKSNLPRLILKPLRHLKTVAVSATCWAIAVTAPGLARALCPGDGIQSISRPVAESAAETFEYKFRFQCIDPSWPTVIVIPGGPGQTSTDAPASPIAGVNMIYTDPRGTGVNKSYWDVRPSGKRVTTEDVADDVRAVIKSLGLKSYAVSATSFGTAVATILASKSENDPTLTLPKALVFQGTIGRALGRGEQERALQALWTLQEANSDYCVECYANRLLTRFSPMQIGGMIEALLQEGAGGRSLKDYLTTSDLSQVREMIKTTEGQMDSGQLQLYRHIGCHEFSKIGVEDLRYSYGMLSYVSRKSCEGESLDAPFDSAKWKIFKTPIIYFAGTHDIATPFTHTAYHLARQNPENTKLVCVNGAGHNALTHNLAACRDKIWGSILRGPRTLESVVLSCGSAAVTTVDKCEPFALKVEP